MFQLNIKKLLGPVAFLAAMGMAFAFTPKRASNDLKSPNGISVWLKYDCSNPGEVLFTSEGNISTAADPASEDERFSDCTGQETVCARLFDIDDLELADDQVNYIPKEDKEESFTEELFCFE